MRFKPEKIYISEDVIGTSITRHITNRFKTTEQTILREGEVPDDLTRKNRSLSEGKKIIHLKRYMGNPFKRCPGFSDDVLCCNYYVIDVVENCPLDCTYCILQAFINKPAITVHANLEEIVEKTIVTIKNEPQHNYRVGTGEHTDSLALDFDLNINRYLVQQFSTLSNATLELKTKTANIDNLIGLNHRGRTVISWSLNPPEIIKKHEFKTATLEDRLRAAAIVANEGYKIAFHLDPIIYYTNWRSAYKQVVEMMMDSVPNEKIVWISLGTLRFIPALKKIAEGRFNGLSIFCNEFTPAHDGKMRYLKPIRKELLASISGWIRERSPDIPLYLCMEKKSVWGNTLGSCPANHSELEDYLNRRT